MQRLFLAFLALGLAAPPAAALDLTGTWQATKELRCKLRTPNAIFSEPEANLATLEITQTGETLYILVNEGGGAYENKYQGLSLTHPKKSEKGYATASACSIGGKYFAGTFFVRKARADAERGKLWVSYYGTNFSTVAECKGRYERVSSADPMVPATCP